MTALCLSGVHFREPAVGVSRCGTDCAVSCLSRFPEAFWCVGGSVRPTLKGHVRVGVQLSGCASSNPGGTASGNGFLTSRRFLKEPPGFFYYRRAASTLLTRPAGSQRTHMNKNAVHIAASTLFFPEIVPGRWSCCLRTGAHRQDGKRGELYENDETD